MRVAIDEEYWPPFWHQIPFGVFVSLIGPFALLLALGLSVSCGLVYPTRVDLLWATNSTRSVAGEQDPALTDSTLITLHRSMCLGMCPEYTLKLWGSGRVEYDGKAWVCEYGLRTALADPGKVSHLVRAMVATGYFGYSWQKGAYWTDSPTVTTSLRHDGRRYEVAHYHGDEGAPQWLRSMEDEIDRVAGTQRWLAGRGVDWVPRCASPDGSTRVLTMYAGSLGQ